MQQSEMVCTFQCVSVKKGHNYIFHTTERHNFYDALVSMHTNPDGYPYLF